MKNSFCRICRGRFNLKYPPAAVDSERNKPTSRTIAVRIDESGEISENICWECEDTLLDFHKSVGEDNEDEEEPVVVDDDEILYKSLAKTRRIHCMPKKVEIIEIDSSDSEHEERVTIPTKEEIVRVESASTIVDSSRKNCKAPVVQVKTLAVNKNTSNVMNNLTGKKKDAYSRGKVFESMRCPICPYLSGVELEVVFHIRNVHPQYTGEHLRFEHRDGDSTLTRRIIFVHLWTFFECKACGKLHDRFWPHRKHLTAHDRKNSKNSADDRIILNNNKVFSSDVQVRVQTSKRALDSLVDSHDVKNRKTTEKCVLQKNSKDNDTVQQVSDPPKATATKSCLNNVKTKQCHSTSKKSKSKALVRKQQLLEARREKRLQKRKQEKKLKPKAKAKEVIPKPTFKMPQQPAPRASSVIKQLLHHPRYTCKHCSQTLTSFIAWNMHMLRLHPSVEFNTSATTPDSSVNICKKCDKCLASASDLRLHIRLSHRRKNRLVEINGNDNEEVCRQTLTPKKESKEELQKQSNLSIPLVNGILTTPHTQATSLSTALNSALLCSFCGGLLPSFTALRIHESSHVTNEDVKRFSIIKSRA